MNQILTKRIIFVFSAIFWSSHSLAATKAKQKAPEKEWTFLMFLNGNNNLDYAATEDVNEMEEVGSTDSVNVVVQWASMRRTSVQRLLIQKDDNSDVVNSPVVEDMGPVDMGDWKSFVDFVAWGKEHYPAKKYFITIWNHGGGWHLNQNDQPAVKDISWDDKTGHSIRTEQLGFALNEISGILGQKVDIYGSDACLMSMVEVAGEMTEAVQVMVGSQEVEPADGWPYAAFFNAWKNLGPESDAASVASILTRTYKESYENGDQSTSAQVTLSALDLSKTAELNASVAALASAIENQSDEGKEQTSHAAGRTISFYESDYIDLGDFANQLQIASPSFDQNVLENLNDALRKYVISNDVTESYSAAKGVSIWMPSSNYTYDLYIDRYAALNFARSTGWNRAVSALMK